jgi:hypothetical protein
MLEPPAVSRIRGLARIELVALLVAGATLLAVLAPVLAQLDGMAAGSGSAANLRTLHTAHACYAADWEDRQFTAVPDDFGEYGGNCATYVNETGCYPPLILGWSCEPVRFYAYRVGCEAYGGGSSCGNRVMTVPLNFDTGLRVGSFRLQNTRPVHDYVNGRVYDPVFYATRDAYVYDDAAPFFDVDCEFARDDSLLPSSYVLSPAAMYHPEVMRARSRGGFRAPGAFDEGFASPTQSQVEHPALKTRILEHHWLGTTPSACHPAYVGPLNQHRPDCNPYLFNHGAAAAPFTLFFDGSITALRTGDVVDDDLRVLKQTGGVDGLWSRDTPLGEDGYFGAFAVDGTRVSHHILTTDGALGRDRLADP